MAFEIDAFLSQWRERGQRASLKHKEMLIVTIIENDNWINECLLALIIYFHKILILTRPRSQINLFKQKNDLT